MARPAPVHGMSPGKTTPATKRIPCVKNNAVPGQRPNGNRGKA